MPPLRVLHVAPYAPGAWAYGGIPRLTATLTRELALSGHDVTLCTTDACDGSARLPAPISASRLRAWPVQHSSDGVHSYVFPNVSNRLAYRWQFFTPIGLGRFLRERARSFDVAHLHACRNIPGVIAARYLRRAGVPYLVAPNGTAPVIERRRVMKRVFDTVVAPGFLTSATGVLAVSDAERRQLLELGLPPSRIHLLPNPIDLDEFTQPPTKGRFREKVHAGATFMVLFLGQLTPRKRVDLLVRAFARLQDQDTCLVLAGSDMGALAAIRTLVSDLGLATRVHITGLLRGSDRLEALADADVVVYPSEHEVFGLVPLEALLAGTPVIVADDSGCGEIVRKTGGGQVVPAGDVEALTRALQRVSEAGESWRQAATDAAAVVRRAYDGRTIGTALADLYRTLINR